MSFVTNSPRILVIDNYAPDHPDYENITKMTGILFRKKAQKQISAFCSRLFFQKVHITFQKAEELSKEALLQSLFSSEWDLIIASGSPFNTNEKKEWISDQIHAYQKVLSDGINAPFLGICFGHQLMALAGGGKIDALNQYYHGDSELLLKEGGSIPIFRSHQYYVSRISKTTSVLATSKDIIENKRIPYALSYHSQKRHQIITLQSHPECSLTQKECSFFPLLQQWLGLQKVSHKKPKKL